MRLFSTFYTLAAFSGGVATRHPPTDIRGEDSRGDRLAPPPYSHCRHSKLFKLRDSSPVRAVSTSRNELQVRPGPIFDFYGHSCGQDREGARTLKSRKTRLKTLVDAGI